MDACFPCQRHLEGLSDGAASHRHQSTHCWMLNECIWLPLCWRPDPFKVPYAASTSFWRPNSFKIRHTLEKALSKTKRSGWKPVGWQGPRQDGPFVTAPQLTVNHQWVQIRSQQCVKKMTSWRSCRTRCWMQRRRRMLRRRFLLLQI